MAFDITTFRSNLKWGGARTNLFSVSITNPVLGIADLEIPIKCRAASLPAVTNNPIEVAYFGRRVKYPGNRTIEDWNVTIINDEDFLIRNALEAWSNGINSFEGNTRTLGSSSPELYKSEAVVRQYSQTEAVLRTYKFIGIFPTQISPIELDWDSDGIQNFNVNFSVDYYYVDDNITGDAGGR